MICTTTTTKNCEFIAFFLFLSFVVSETERDEVEYKLLPGGPSNENENKDPKKAEVSGEICVRMVVNTTCLCLSIVT